MSLSPGFADAPRDAQRAFRSILAAMSRPGLVVELGLAQPPETLSPAAAAALLALADSDTPIWLDTAAAAAAPWLRFHCGSPVTAEPMAARFAYCRDPGLLPRLDSFALGSDEYPDRSTTLVLAVEALGEPGPLRLVGPGIDGERRVAIDGPDVALWNERRALSALFPRGLDLILTAGRRLLALPRTTAVEG